MEARATRATKVFVPPPSSKTTLPPAESSVLIGEAELYFSTLVPEFPNPFYLLLFHPFCICRVDEKGKKKKETEKQRWSDISINYAGGREGVCSSVVSNERNTKEIPKDSDRQSSAVGAKNERYLWAFSRQVITHFQPSRQQLVWILTPFSGRERWEKEVRLCKLTSTGELVSLEILPGK